MDESFWGELYLWCVHREGEVFDGVSEVSVESEVVVCDFRDVLDGGCFVGECCDEACEHVGGYVGE